MTTKKKNEVNEVNEVNWLTDLNIESIEKSASLDIKPQIKIELNETKIVEIVSLPILTEFSGKESGNKYFVMNLKYNDLDVQMNVNAKSFRFSLAVLSKRLGGMDKLIGKSIAITKALGNTKEFKNAKMYSIQLIE